MRYKWILALSLRLVPDNLPLYNWGLRRHCQIGWRVDGPIAATYLLSLVQAVLTKRLLIRWQGAYRIWWTRHAA